MLKNDFAPTQSDVCPGVSFFRFCQALLSSGMLSTGTFLRCQSQFCSICSLISHSLSWGHWTTWQRRSPLNGSVLGCESSGSCSHREFCLSTKVDYYPKNMDDVRCSKILHGRYSQIVMVEHFGAPQRTTDLVMFNLPTLHFWSIEPDPFTLRFISFGYLAF